jgi:phenylpropionate dioxygenase-like ring-hydroxylating dioxygenase large terminal subunit
VHSTGTPSAQSAPHLTQAWYVLAKSDALTTRPLSRSLFGRPLVLFRDAQGQPQALEDRCPHRNVPLSLGAVDGDQLQCAYHGWTFDGAGRCVRIPASLRPPDAQTRCVPAFAIREQQGWIWIWGQPSAAQGRRTEPDQAPYMFPDVDAPGTTVVRYEASFAASLISTLENILDVPHTAFLHRGLFRTEPSTRIRAEVSHSDPGVACEYFGEKPPAGWLGKILARRGQTLRHVDRFLLPSIAQVEYAYGPQYHLRVTSALTPVSETRTDMFTMATLKSPAPDALVKTVLLPLAKQVLRQDQDILQAQTENIERFAQARFVSTEVDLLGPQIVRRLAQAIDGNSASEWPSPRTIELLA